MRHLPLFADLKGRDCLVIGGGAVAARRVKLLLEAGAAVTVLATELAADELRALASERAIAFTATELDARQLQELSLDPYWLIIAATGDRALNARVAERAHAEKRFCNVVDDPRLCTFIMPAIVDRDPVTIAVATGGHSPTLSRWTKGLIETMLPARLGSLAALAGRWRGRVKDALPETAERQRFWEGLFGGDVAQQTFAGREAAADAGVRAALERWSTEEARRGGEAYLVGAGPGSPDLLTIRGRQLLAAADVVLYDRLVSAELLSYARRDAELVCVGKTPRRPSITQKQLNRLLIRLVQSGKRVCRLKGGDPMIFGRGGEELEALAAAGLRFQVVPGVSAAEGCAAYAGIPLTLRGVSHAVLMTTGHAQGDGAPALPAFRAGHTLALYMGVAQYAEISEQLIALGHAPDTPVAIVENGTTDRQRVIRAALGHLARAHAAFEVRPPALLIVGDTTRLAERYSWFAPGKLEIFEDESARSLARVSY